MRARVNPAHRVQADDFYAEKNLDKLRLNTTTNHTFVLLVTYARSGSTWLGEITNKAESTFYVYEPLFRIVVEGYYKKGVVCFNNNTCRYEVHTCTILEVFVYNCLLTRFIFLKKLQQSSKNCNICIGVVFDINLPIADYSERHHLQERLF